MDWSDSASKPPRFRIQVDDEVAEVVDDPGHSPAGHGMSGMLCHRDAKEQYLAVRSKGDYGNGGPGLSTSVRRVISLSSIRRSGRESKHPQGAWSRSVAWSTLSIGE